MSDSDSELIVVVGSSVAALSAVLRCALNNDKVLFITKSQNENSLYESMVNNLEKVPGFSQFVHNKAKLFTDTISFIKEGHFSDKLTIVEDIPVTQVIEENSLFKIDLVNGDNYICKYVIYCDGANYKQPLADGNELNLLTFENVVTSDFGDEVESMALENRNVVVFGKKEEVTASVQVLKERFGSVNITVIDEDIESIETKDKKLISISTLNNVKVECDVVYLLLGYEINLNPLNSLDIKLDKTGAIISSHSGESSVDKFYVSGAIRSDTRNHIYTEINEAVGSADSINAKIRAHNRKIQLDQFRK